VASLSFDSVSLTYEGSDRAVRALERVKLAVAEGEPVSVIGPSGCGKSTMLLLAAGLLAPSEGTVRVAGEPIDGVRRTTSLILQDFGLFPWKTVFRNAALGLEIRGHGSGELQKRVGEALDRVGLAEFASAYPDELSGGMRQRVALARALALDADLLLMDEPLSALDALTREDLQDVLLDLWRQRGHTAVLVTHSIEEAVYLGRRVVVLSPRPGRVSAIVDNPTMGAGGYRDTPEFYERCIELRRLLAEEGAVHPSAYATAGAQSVGTRASGSHAEEDGS
jgi:ABC-type nitrate/sulfonate/bicarbonate transport system ATPase subunit